MQNVSISAAESKWARNSLSLSQKQVSELAEKAGKPVPLSRLKVFEAGYFRPSDEFARNLRSLYEQRGIDFADFAPPPKSEPDNGNVPQLTKGRRTCFYLDSTMDEDEAQRWFDVIESNQERIQKLCAKVPTFDRDGDMRDETLELHHQLLNCLALDSLMLRTLIGANPVEAKALGGKKARTLGSVLADFFHKNRSALEHEVSTDGDDSEALGEEEAA